uniref:Putative transmembrane and coiled-coil domain-containing protein 4-like n=1 Tax=Davidia involucrata TaxID=16924 RepID=A0A5B6YUZ9_DAVIN
METSILPPTQKYAASALYALALHQSQIHQTKSSTSVVPLDEEPVGDGMSVGGSTSVSEESQLWINENSGLLCPVFRFLDVDNQAWHGLKETAKSSSQVRHHIGAVCFVFSCCICFVLFKQNKKKELFVRLA